MPDTINYKCADIVLVNFTFSEGKGSKKRPSLIISNDSYHKSRHEIIILAITSNTQRILYGDTMIETWKEANLLRPSVVTGIVRTIKTHLIIRKLGELSLPDLKHVRENLIKIICSDPN